MRVLGNRRLRALKQVASCGACEVTKGLSRFAGRDPLLWVFGARAGEAFVDNAKYCYLHVAAHHPEIRPVWLSKNRAVVTELRANGYEAHHTYSPRGLALTRRAGAVFCTHGLGDVVMSCSGGALIVMLWHGTPLKRISWDAGFERESLAVRAAAAYAYRQVGLLTAAGETTVGPFASGLGVDPAVIVPTGYPRNDALERDFPGSDIGTDAEARRTIEHLASEGDVWLYLPTFRQIGATAGIGEAFDFAALDRFLEAHDASLAIKAHPFERLDLGEERSRIHRLPAATDVYPLLRYTDGLLTDYSSVYFDYLLLDRPVVFYPYDLDRYRAERGFYYDYEAVTPGPTARTFEELVAALDRSTSRDDYAGERRTVRERFCRTDGDRAEAVCEAVLDRL